MSLKHRQILDAVARHNDGERLDDLAAEFGVMPTALRKAAWRLLQVKLTNHRYEKLPSPQEASLYLARKRVDGSYLDPKGQIRALELDRRGQV